MKTTLLILLLGTASLLAKEPTSEDYFKAGEAALAKNDLETAKKYYAAAVKINPQNGNARFRLLSMGELNKQARVKLREQRLAEIKLPVVDFEDFTLQESIEALSVMIEKASEETFIPNFVIADPTGELEGNLVTLKLRNIPASTALTYVLSQAKAQHKVDEHIVRIRPLSAGSANEDETGNQ